MQTFLPHASFHQCATILDDKRLGKQRVEAKQILNALQGKSKGWRNHPATLMWYGYEKALCFYHDCMVSEWMRRGFKNKMPFLHPYGFVPDKDYPHWWHDDVTLDKIMNSHRSNLLRKNWAYYQPVLSKRRLSLPPDNLPYFWPVTKEEVEAKRVLEFCS
jgi:hypothetical protein